MYVRNGTCSNEDCPCSHLSQDQVKRALGQGGYEKPDQSRGSNEADKGSRGRGKGKGKDKNDARGQSAGARDGEAVATETTIQQLRSKPRWCTAHLKGLCPKGDSCPSPHLYQGC